MQILHLVESKVMSAHAEGRRPLSVSIPEAGRRAFEKELRSARSLNADDDLPLHVLGVMYAFDGDSIELKYAAGA